MVRYSPAGLPSSSGRPTPAARRSRASCSSSCCSTTSNKICSCCRPWCLHEVPEHVESLLVPLQPTRIRSVGAARGSCPNQARCSLCPSPTLRGSGDTPYIYTFTLSDGRNAACVGPTNRKLHVFSGRYPHSVGSRVFAATYAAALERRTAGCFLCVTWPTVSSPISSCHVNAVSRSAAFGFVFTDRSCPPLCPRSEKNCSYNQ